MKVPLFFLKNARHPDGFWGRIFIRNMNRGHAALTAWALGLFEMNEAEKVVDIGCGGGRAVHLLDRAEVAGRVYGIDYSQTSVDVASKRNAKAIAEGRVEIIKGSVSDLPFENDFMDYAISVESYYFWPDLIEDLKEIRRILRPEGEFMLVAEMYKNESNTETQKQFVKDLNMRNLTLEEFRQVFLSAGFRNIRITCHDVKGWIAVLGIK